MTWFLAGRNQRPYQWESSLDVASVACAFERYLSPSSRLHAPPETTALSRALHGYAANNRGRSSAAGVNCSFPRPPGLLHRGAKGVAVVTRLPIAWPMSLARHGLPRPSPALFPT